MKRTIGILALTLVGSLSLADHRLPVGSFEGTGTWRGLDGSSGQYASRLIINQDRITIEAQYDQQGKARTERHSLTLAPQGEGFYQLLDDEGEAVGQLACLDDQCAYGVRKDGLTVTETWRLDGSELQKFGTKNIGGFLIVWNETLVSN